MKIVKNNPWVWRWVAALPRLGRGDRGQSLPTTTASFESCTQEFTGTLNNVMQLLTTCTLGNSYKTRNSLFSCSIQCLQPVSGIGEMHLNWTKFPISRGCCPSSHSLSPPHQQPYRVVAAWREPLRMTETGIAMQYKLKSSL